MSVEQHNTAWYWLSLIGDQQNNLGHVVAENKLSLLAADIYHGHPQGYIYHLFSCQENEGLK